MFDDESESSLPLALDVSSLAVGEHRIGVRYRDGAGNWSPVTWTDLVIYPQTPTAEARTGGFATTNLAPGNILSGDPGQGAGTALTPQDGLFDDESESSLRLTLDASSLAVGEHRIGVRYRDGRVITQLGRT